jgi:putative endonuclease
MVVSDSERASGRTRAEEESKGRSTPPPHDCGVAHGKPATSPVFVYILLCSDGTYYVGCTADLHDRERVHNESHGAEYTASRRPVRLVYSEECDSWPAARDREAQLKRWPHAKKQALVDGDGQRLHTLAKRRG